MPTDHARPASLNLRAGDLVEVRSVDEILATLDAHATFEGVPFMPEMLKYCGQRLRVVSRAEKTCDRVERSGIRAVTGSPTVHLEGIRCDGAFHGGCQALCLTLWKEAWLKRAQDAHPDAATAAAAGEVSAQAVSAQTLPQAVRIFAAAQHTPPGADTIYSCQATETLRYTTAPTPEAKKYWRDVRCGNASWRAAARAWVVERFNRFQARRGGTQYPPLGGITSRTPVARLDVQPGELVRVKTRDEIFTTIDLAEGKNRGLTFDREMLQYCGRTFKVLQRVEKFIDEPTGRMLTMKSDCVILEGAVCESRYHGLCPKAIYPFWREIWLERARDAGPRRGPAGEQSFAAFALTSAFQMIVRRVFGRRNPAPASMPGSR